MKNGKVRNNKLGRMIKKLFYTLLLLFMAAVTAGVVFAIIQIYHAPEISEVDATPHGYLTTIFDKDENVINHLSVTESNRIYVKLEEIPLPLQRAFVAIEDERFYDHHGIDIKGILRAAYRGISSGFHFSEGASTITQQLLKNNVFDGWMSEQNFYDRLSRKVQEWYLAIQLEREYSKNWILENYLNTINLGGGTRGVQVAAQYYFGKDVSELTLAESALIAGITKNPNSYNPLKNPEKSIERQELVLDKMLELGMITQEAYDQAMLENVLVHLNEDSKNKGIQIFSWFEDALLTQIVEDLTAKYKYTEDEAWDLLYSGGLTIHSTQNTQLQDICESVTVSSQWYTGGEEISVVMTDVSTGGVSAIIGGRQEKVSSLIYNRATSSVRQPGSTIKVIGEYAAALDTMKISLGTVLDDAPYAYSDGTPIHNSYDSYKGMIPVREAIAVSGNVHALKVFQMVGADSVYEYLQKFGLTTLTQEDKVESLSIGGTYNGVTNLELTAAYNAIANDGTYIRPYFYTKVLDRDNKVLLENSPSKQQVITKETAQLLTIAMEEVIKSGTGQDAIVEGVSLAGKSGTTNENKDLWFVGYSAYYTCGVWGGYDDNSAQENNVYVKNIWQDIMEAAHKEKTNVELVENEQFQKVTICKKCGNLASKGICSNSIQGDMTYSEYFRKDEVPTKYCSCHEEYIICKESEMCAGQYCPKELKITKVYLKNATPGTEDEPYCVPDKLRSSQNGEENSSNTCNVHTHFWDSWFSSDGTPQDNGNKNQENSKDTDGGLLEEGGRWLDNLW